MRFSEKTVIITGSTSGMGFLSAKCFAKEGANVVLVDIDKEALEAKVAEIRADGGKVIGVATDVRDYRQVVAARDAALNTFSTVDIMSTSQAELKPVY